MRRLIALLLLVGLLFSLSGCGKEETKKAPEPTMSSQEMLALAWQLSQAQSQQRKQQALSTASLYLKISDVNTTTSGSSIKCTGKITNYSSDTTYKFVKVKGAFQNNSGKVLDTDWTYAVGGEGLAPGESSTFSMYVDENYEIKKCDVSLLDADT